MPRIPGHDYAGLVAEAEHFDWDGAHDFKTWLESKRFPVAEELISTPVIETTRRDELKDQLVAIGHAQARINAHIARLAGRTTVDVEV